MYTFFSRMQPSTTGWNNVLKHKICSDSSVQQRACRTFPGWKKQTLSCLDWGCTCERLARYSEAFEDILSWEEGGPGLKSLFQNICLQYLRDWHEVFKNISSWERAEIFETCHLWDENVISFKTLLDNSYYKIFESFAMKDWHDTRRRLRMSMCKMLILSLGGLNDSLDLCLFKFGLGVIHCERV